MAMGAGSLDILFSRPIAMTFLVLAAVVLAAALYVRLRQFNLNKLEGDGSA
jgi:TctA family transporter